MKKVRGLLVLAAILLFASGNAEVNATDGHSYPNFDIRDFLKSLPQEDFDQAMSLATTTGNPANDVILGLGRALTADVIEHAQDAWDNYQDRAAQYDQQIHQGEIDAADAIEAYEAEANLFYEEPNYDPHY